MPRAKLGHVSDEYAMELLVKHHIAAFRRAKDRTREITRIRHVQFGWMFPEQYYQLQKVHDVMPLLEKFVEGGYRLKASLIGANISFANVSVPIGIGFYGAAIGTSVLYATGTPNPNDTPEQRQAAQELIDISRLVLAAIALPFGDLFLPILYVELLIKEAAAAAAASTYREPTSGPLGRTTPGPIPHPGAQPR